VDVAANYWRYAQKGSPIALTVSPHACAASALRLAIEETARWRHCQLAVLTPPLPGHALLAVEATGDLAVHCSWGASSLTMAAHHIRREASLARDLAFEDPAAGRVHTAWLAAGAVRCRSPPILIQALADSHEEAEAGSEHRPGNHTTCFVEDENRSQLSETAPDKAKEQCLRPGGFSLRQHVAGGRRGGEKRPTFKCELCIG
jgi:hypothetical protein